MNDNSTTEQEIKVKPPVNLPQLLRREINLTTNQLSKKDGQDLIPSVLTYFKNILIQTANDPDSLELSEEAGTIEAQTSIYLFKYAEAIDLEQLFPFLDDQTEAVRLAGVRTIVDLLYKEPEDNLFLSEQFFHRLTQDLNSPNSPTLIPEAVKEMVRISAGHYLPLFLKELSIQPFNARVPETLTEIANNYSFLATIQMCRGLAYTAEFPEERRVFETMISYLEPSKERQEIVESLEDLYERIHFENYIINQKVTDTETKLLTQAFPDKTAAYLDIGCGTGRLLRSLSRQDYTDLYGIDFVPKHIKIAHEAAPEAKLVIGSWHNLPYPDKHFEGAYILGRNDLHNLTLQDQMATFAEARRVIKDEGTLWVDLPDVTRGSYAEEVRRFLDEAQTKGITNIEEGLIYDSPDGLHYYNRFAPTRQQMEALCELTGLTIKQVNEREIPNGKGDVNLYYELEKKPDFSLKSIPYRRLYELMRLFSPLSATLPSYLSSEDPGHQTKPDQTTPPLSGQSVDD